MSQLKNTRSKRKHLPTEISVSLRTPKSRKYLFDGESASGTPKAQEHTDGNENIKKSKRKKLRKTQNLPQADDMNSESSSITVSRKKSSTKGSVSSAVDGDISSDVSQELEVKPKSKRKKMKLPEVNLNDFDDTLKTQKKKNVSMDSISSSTSDIINVNPVQKKTKKKRSNKSKRDDAALLQTSSTGNNGNDDNVFEMEDYNKENSTSTNESDSIKTSKRPQKVKSQESEPEEKVAPLRATRKRRIADSESVYQTEESDKNTENSSGGNTKTLRKRKKLRKTASTEKIDEVNSVKDLKTSKRKKNVKSSTDGSEKMEENTVKTRTSKKSRLILNAEIIIQDEDTKESIDKSTTKFSKIIKKSMDILNSESTDESEKAPDNEKIHLKTRNSCRAANETEELEEGTMKQSENQNLESTEEIQNEELSTKKLNVENTRLSRKSWNISSKEVSINFVENSENTRTSKKSLNIEVADTCCIKDRNIDRSQSRNSRKSWRTLLEEVESQKNEFKPHINTSDIAEHEANKKTLHVENARISRKSWQSPTEVENGALKEFERSSQSLKKILNETVDLEENNFESHEDNTEETFNVGNPSNVRKSWQCILRELNGISDKTIEDTSRELRSSRKSRKTLESKSSECKKNESKSRKSLQVYTVNSEEENNKINNDTSFNKQFDSVLLDDIEENGNDDIVLSNGIMKNTSSTPFNNSTISNQKTRKRWTILSDDADAASILSQNFDNEKEIENKTELEIVNSCKVRRSVRKRWSTELKKKSLNPNEFQLKVSSEQNSSIIDFKDTLTAKSSPNTSRRSVIKIDDSFNGDSTFVLNQSDKLLDFYSESEIKETMSSKRNSKRISKSFESLEGIALLDNTVALDHTENMWDQNELADSRKSSRKSQTAAILNRRNTYDKEVTVTDISILKSISETGNFDTEVPISSGKKNVRFEHITRRRPIIKKNGSILSSENKVQAPVMKKTPKLANKSVSFDHTLFSACTASTPLHSLRKNTLLKQTQLKNDSSGLAKRRSRSVEEKSNKCINRIKMPNFAKIHERFNDRLEDITQMAARKAERARLLLSGQKPSANSTFAPNESQKKKVEETKHPRQLKFNHIQQGANSANENPSTAVSNKKGTTPKKLGVPVVAKNDIASVKFNAGFPKNVTAKSAVVKSNSLLAKSGIPKRLQNTKCAPSVLKRVEEIKSVATKSKPQHDNKEERRTILKGVRGNRRFELLMKMRNK